VQPLELHECNRWNCWDSTGHRVHHGHRPGGCAAPGPRRMGGHRSWPRRRARRRGRCCHRSRGGPSRFVAADLTDIGEVRRLAEEAGEVDRIINFASWYGMIGNAGTVGYNITEEAVRSPTRTAAREWGRYAITVNVVAPTAKTDAADNIERADPEAMARGRRRHTRGAPRRPAPGYRTGRAVPRHRRRPLHHRPDPRRGRRVVSARLTRRPLRATPVSR
jgi:hypothetical protein